MQDFEFEISYDQFTRLEAVASTAIMILFSILTMSLSVSYWKERIWQWLEWSGYMDWFTGMWSKMELQKQYKWSKLLGS